MSHAHILDERILNLIPNNSNTVLDVACGYGFWGFLIKTMKMCKFLVGIDIWRPYFNKLKHFHIYDDLIILKLPYIPFSDKVFDITLACEILEHLKKENGLRLLSELERVTRKMIIVSTPLDCPQDATSKNPFLEHVTEWRPFELRRLGYQVQEVKTLPKTVALVDKFRRMVTKLGKTPTYLVAIRNLDHNMAAMR